MCVCVGLCAFFFCQDVFGSSPAPCTLMWCARAMLSVLLDAPSVLLWAVLKSVSTAASVSATKGNALLSTLQPAFEYLNRPLTILFGASRALPNPNARTHPHPLPRRLLALPLPLVVCGVFPDNTNKQNNPSVLPGAAQGRCPRLCPAPSSRTSFWWPSSLPSSGSQRPCGHGTPRRPQRPCGHGTPRRPPPRRQRRSRAEELESDVAPQLPPAPRRRLPLLPPPLNPVETGVTLWKVGT